MAFYIKSLLAKPCRNQQIR